MATDYLFGIFFWPVVIGLGLILLIQCFSRHKESKRNAFGIKIRSLFAGMLWSFVGLLGYLLLLNYFEAIARIAQFDSLTDSDLLSLMASWTIYLFVLLSPFVALFHLLALPLILALLKRFRLVSVFGALLVAIVIALIDAGSRMVGSSGEWCRTNATDCVAQALFNPLPIAVPIALGFALGAGLPWVRSEANEPQTAQA